MLMQRDRNIKKVVQTNHQHKPFSKLTLGLLGRPTAKTTAHKRENKGVKAVDRLPAGKPSGQQWLPNSQNKQNNERYNNCFHMGQNTGKEKDLCRMMEEENENSSVEVVCHRQILNLNDLGNSSLGEEDSKGQDQKEAVRGQNQEECKIQNRLYVDMRKKIRKASKTRKHHYGDFLKRWSSNQNRKETEPECVGSKLTAHQATQGRIFFDREIFSDGCVYRNKVITQRMDNDADSDDEQIVSAVRRIHRGLADATAHYAPHCSRDRLLSTLVEQKQNSMREDLVDRPISLNQGVSMNCCRS